ncbi:MAG: hypothetical protein AABW52_05860 [Nanoarchaeota archaeon]
MVRILLDTNIVDFLSQYDGDSLKNIIGDVSTYISLETVMELSNGFYANNKYLKIDELLNVLQTRGLGNILLIKEEIQEYPFIVDIDKYVKSHGAFLKDIKDHDKFKKSCLEYNDNNIHHIRGVINEIKEKLSKEKINFDDLEIYHRKLKEWIKMPECKLKDFPFNTILRAFIIEKFIIYEDYKFTNNDIRDLLISSKCIYFDKFFTENKSYNIINKIISKRGLQQIFKEGFKVYNKRELMEKLK